jgi:hypothetical protein
LKRFIGALILALLCLPIVGPAGARPTPTATGFNEYLMHHLDVPAVKQADRFIATQESSGQRAQGGGDYGRTGCKAPAYEVGDERTFWVSQNVANMPQGNREITATLAAKSEHGYEWVQNEFYLPTPGEAPEGGFVTQGEAESALEDWDKIYDVNRSYFGSEPNTQTQPSNLPPGLPKDWRDADCDGRIHILNFPIDTPGSSLGYIAGYYSAEHEFPNGEGEHESPYSNEAEMFFMNSATLNVGDDTYSGVLAHEFFHMIQFGNDYNEATWVNEGMADIAAAVNGFGDIVEGHISAYSEDPDQHLFDWKSDVADYGQAFLFFDYLFNHYGAPEDKKTDRLEAYGLAELLTRTSADGDKGITKVLRSRAPELLGQLDPYFRKGNFTKVFKDYLVANFLDLPEASHGQWGYANRDVKVAAAGTGDESPADSSVHPYGGEYYELTGEGALDSAVQDPVAVIPAREGQPAPGGGYFAWSNRADEMISWMQRKADLSKATAPSLNFKHWYFIEEDWDYGYVRVSKDGGKTWEFVNTTDCGGRATNPNGQNRATLESGGITGDSAGWQDCTLDLTPFAGGKVLIRFEYDSDQAVTEPGWAIDNVKLTDGNKTLWKPTKFETKKQSKAWKFGGDSLLKWTRIKPLAKNKPLLQVLTVSGDTVRRRVLLRKAFKKGGDLGLLLAKQARVAGEKTVLIYSGLTPIATDPFPYTYKVNR